MPAMPAAKVFFIEGNAMTETEFLELAEAEMNRLQDEVEAKYDDADCTRSGNVLTIELEDGAEVVVNIQAPMQEIWLASHLGGYHFAPRAGDWISSRDGRNIRTVLFEALDALIARGH